MTQLEILGQISSGSFTGRVDDLPAEVYHRAPYLSYSGLKRFDDAPAQYKVISDRREVIGTGTHGLVLEPAAFRMKVKVIQDRRGKRGEEAAALAADGYFVVTEGEWQQIQALAKAVTDNPHCAALLTNGKPEVSLFYVDPVTGLRMKARVDWLRDDGMQIDLKYFNTVTKLKEIQRQCHRMKYHWQAAWYLDVQRLALGVDSNKFVHIFIRDSEAYASRPVMFYDAELELARMQYGALIPKFLECQAKNQWPAYEPPPEIITMIGLPAYAYSEVEV